MKKLTLFFTFAVIGIVHSQSTGVIKYASYFNTKFKKSYEINVSQDDDGALSFIIEMSSIDAMDCKAMVYLNESETQSLKEYLTNLKKTFKEWKSVAVANKVETLQKDIDYDLPCMTSLFKCPGHDWGTSNTTCFTSYFKISKGLTYVRMKAFDLEDINRVHPTSAGMDIIFSNEKDFDGIIYKLDIAAAKRHIESQKSTASLFKSK